MGGSLMISGEINISGGSIKGISTKPAITSTCLPTSAKAVMYDERELGSLYKIAQSTLPTTCDTTELAQESTIAVCALSNIVAVGVSAFTDEIPETKKNYQQFISGAMTPVTSGASVAVPPSCCTDKSNNATVESFDDLPIIAQYKDTLDAFSRGES